MSANPRVRVTIRRPVVSVDCHRKGDLRALTVRQIIEFGRDLEQAVEAGLDENAEIKWSRTSDYGKTYAAQVSSEIRRTAS